jgi:hypothetical protein
MQCFNNSVITLQYDLLGLIPGVHFRRSTLAMTLFFILQHDDKSHVSILSISIPCEVLQVQPLALISHIDPGE